MTAVEGDSQAALVSPAARWPLQRRGPRTVAASGRLGTVARHQPPQTDLPSSESVHRLESVRESLTGRRGLETPTGRSRSRVAMWLRSIGLVVSPARRWRPVRMCSEPGRFCWAALT
jgi:hypothetical protein